MKRLNKYMMLFVAALALVSCVDDVVDTPSTEINAKFGDEVQFGVTLPTTRTVYGDKSDTAYDLYWVEGDKVQIYSPQASKNNAEYKVIPTTVEADKNKPYYADRLVITGENGVQWGEGEVRVIDGVKCSGVHDFYSVYPSGNYTFETGEDENGNEVMLAKGVRVSNMQVITYDGNTSFNNGFQYNMSNCLMYANTPNVKMEDGKVNLTYTPLSTVLEFELIADSDSQIQPNQSRDFTIMGITLTATEGTNISGEFDLNVTNGSFYSWGSTASNEIKISINDATALQGGKYTIKGSDKNNNKLIIPVFLAPDVLNIDGWVISIDTNQGTYKKTLTKENFEMPNLEAGMIHKIKLPKLLATGEGWDVSTWMKYIPRNVYLSEVSIPGSWNTINSDAQGKTTNYTSIETQYAKGVRAFHFDTRWRTDDTSVSILGYYTGSINGLSVAGSATSDNYNSTGGARVVGGNGRSFYDYMKDIVGNIKPDEYMVVMCTFAQDSYDYTGANGNWAGEISYQCSQIIEEYGDVIYNGQDLTANTVVGDVLGKIIVIVNMEGSYTELPNDSACLFVNMPLTLNSNMFGATLNDNNVGVINKGVLGTTGVADTGIDMYHSHAQICVNTDDAYPSNGNDRTNVDDRGFAPTLAERKTVANNILDWSKNNYSTSNYNHDKWIYLGLGGYYFNLVHHDAGWFNDEYYSLSKDDSSYDDVANYFSTWIDGKLNEMKGTAAAPYYPVGIVLMNYVNDHTSTIENILMLNNRYQLQYDPDKSVDYVPGAGDTEGPNEE